MPLSPKARLGIVIGSVALVIVVLGSLWLTNRASRPSEADIAAFLNREIGRERAQFESVDYKVVGKQLNFARLEFEARAIVRETLYHNADVAPWLRRQNFDSTAFAAAQALVSASDGLSLREWAGLPPTPPDPAQLTVLRAAVTRGQAVRFAGTINAHKRNGGWTMTIESGRFTESDPEGRPRSAFAEAYVEGDAADEQKLAQTIAAARDFAVHVSAAAKQYAPQLAEARRARLERVIGAIAPGSLFAGVARSRRDSTALMLYLEFTARNDNPRTITAALRNDSGGAEHRPFQGEWQADEKNGRIKLRLTTLANQRVIGAGPLLDDQVSWTIDGEIAANGAFVARSETLDYEFQRVEAADLARTRSTMLQGQERLHTAVAPKSVYLGSITNRSTGASMRALLRFDSLEPKTSAFAGTFQSLSRASNIRRFTGLAIGNKYRAENQPLRLQILAAHGTGEFFAASWASNAVLQVDGDELRGHLDGFDLAFKAATPDELARIEQARQAAVTAFFAVFRTGAAYDGTARYSDGFVGRLRLRVQKIDELERTATLLIESRDQPGLYSRFTGAYSVEDSSIVATSGEGRINKSGVRKVPFFTHDSTYRVRFVKSEGRIDGTIEDGWYANGWTLEFPIPGNLPQLASPSATAEPDAPAALAAYPTVPTAEGAYLLVNNQWVKLPRNNGRVTYGAAQVIGGILQGLNALSGKPVDAHAPDKLAVLTFDGKDPVPRTAKQSVVLLYRGHLPQPSAADQAKYPVLQSYPSIEAAPLRTGSDGKRHADLIRVVPGVAGFRENRIAGTVEEIDPTLHLLTATATLPTGRYAFAAGTNAFEFEID